jgi:poly(A) polymerase
MEKTFPLDRDLPPEAAAAVAIVRKLAGAGHQALLAGGCVRDLLLGTAPKDYDVATDAPPARVCELFRTTRQVGAQFGVVLVRQRRRWVEVATFRADGAYLDGRHPVAVTLSDLRHDAQRRDFTLNGMYLDPLSMRVVDYVHGRADLEARLIRAIGDPEQRFAEDYLRLLRAVRFSARLRFPIEARTRAAIRASADRLEHVAAERVREELARMLAHPNRAVAWRLLGECELRPHLWPRAGWSDEEARRAEAILERLPADASFELALATLLIQKRPADIERIARSLTLSNDERDTVRWLVEHQADLDQPDAIDLASLKRLMARGAFGELVALARARYQELPEPEQLTLALARRTGSIPTESVAPAPLVTGQDLLARSIPNGPIYGQILEELYTQQLNEQIRTRPEALAVLDRLLAEWDRDVAGDRAKARHRPGREG